MGRIYLSNCSRTRNRWYANSFCEHEWDSKIPKLRSGTVVAIGPEVKGLAIGTRVGVGPQCDSCGVCEYCNNGEEQFCRKVNWTIFRLNNEIF